MNDPTPATYRYNLYPEAAELLIQFDKCIRNFSGVEPSTNAHEYIGYTFSGMQIPFVYGDRRRTTFVVRLDKPFEQITTTIDPEGLCEQGNAFPKFYERKKHRSHVMVCCDSTDRIKYIMNLIQQVFSLKPKLPKPDLGQLKRTLSPEQHKKIVANLNEVSECATKLRDTVRKIQVELGVASQDDSDH